jgi:hypothetical protein
VWGAALLFFTSRKYYGLKLYLEAVPEIHTSIVCRTQTKYKTLSKTDMPIALSASRQPFMSTKSLLRELHFPN